MEWLDERIPHIERSGNWFYSFVCFCLGRRKEKMSYKELYMLLSRLNEKALGEEESKKAALIRILDIYKYLHDGNLPEGAEELENG